MSADDTTRRRSDLHVVFAGHVDHGKSTVIGRLLADAGALPTGRLEQVRALCARNARPFEYAFLIDALKEERDQGITLDAARIHFTTPTRHVLILDVPGHVEFLKNMVTGAAQADAAFLVLDAEEGIRENSRRHATLLALLGLRQLVVLVNKMDQVAYDAARFHALADEFGPFLDGLGLAPLAFVPVSGREGDNLAHPSCRMPWYAGETVLEWLARFDAACPPTGLAFRMPVQDIYRFTENGDARRLIVGSVASGRLAVGDEVVFHPCGKRSRVRSLECFPPAPKHEALAGEAIALTLDEAIYVTRGELLAKAGDPFPQTGRRLRVRLFWMGSTPMIPGREYGIKIGTARVSAWIESIDRVVDASDLSDAPSRHEIGRHRMAECVLRLSHPVACDSTPDYAATRRFVVVDDFEIRGGGLVCEVLPDREPLSDPGTARAPRPAGFTVWFTGLSGAGKSTLACAVMDDLQRRGLDTELLDGDQVREGLSQGLGFTREDRDAHVRRIGYVAELLARHGVIVLVAAISPYEAVRRENRERLGRYVEVYCRCPLDVLATRDVKGLYRRALAGDIPNFTGVSDPYEEPTRPELIVDTDDGEVALAVARVLEMLREHGYLDAPQHTPGT